MSPRAWKQKQPTPLDRGPPLHVNRPLLFYLAIIVSVKKTVLILEWRTLMEGGYLFCLQEYSYCFASNKIWSTNISSSHPIIPNSMIDWLIDWLIRGFLASVHLFVLLSKNHNVKTSPAVSPIQELVFFNEVNYIAA